MNFKVLLQSIHEKIHQVGSQSQRFPLHPSSSPAQGTNDSQIASLITPSVIEAYYQVHSFYTPNTTKNDDPMNEELQQKFFTHVEENTGLYIERLREAVA